MYFCDCTTLSANLRTFPSRWRNFIIRKHGMDMHPALRSRSDGAHDFLFDRWLPWARVLAHCARDFLFSPWGFDRASTRFPIYFHGVYFWNQFFGFWLYAIHSDRTFCGLWVFPFDLHERWVITHWRLDWRKDHTGPFWRFLPLAVQAFVLGFFGLNWPRLLLDFYNLCHVELFWIICSLLRLLPRHQNLPPFCRIINKFFALCGAQAWLIQRQIDILLRIFLVMVNCYVMVYRRPLL